MSEDETTPGETGEQAGPSRLRYTAGTPEENDALHVAEACFAVITSMLPLVPLQVAQGDLNSMRQLEQLSSSINNLGSLVVELGSQLVKPDPNPQGGKPSGLIIPK